MDIYTIAGCIIALTLITVNLLKGKYGMTLIGLFIGPVLWFGAIRLAKPGSWWFERYSSGKRYKAYHRHS